MRNRIVRRTIAVLAMSGIMIMNMIPMAAFANVSEADIAAEEAETVSANEVKDDPEDIAEPEEPQGPLTPDGNLTIVDDYGSPDKSGKQFITVSSKSGNIFYIIIDRDDEGENTVHFLNLVDERDILSLMDEEEIEEIYGAKEEPVVVEEPEIIEEEPEITEPEPEKKKGGFGPVIGGAVIVCGGLAIYTFVRGTTDKKKKKSLYPDPDADYEDDDFLADIEAEEEQTETADEYDTEELDALLEE